LSREYITETEDINVSAGMPAMKEEIAR